MRADTYLNSYLAGKVEVWFLTSASGVLLPSSMEVSIKIKTNAHYNLAYSAIISLSLTTKVWISTWLINRLQVFILFTDPYIILYTCVQMCSMENISLKTFILWLCNIYIFSAHHLNMLISLDNWLCWWCFKGSMKHIFKLFM